MKRDINKDSNAKIIKSNSAIYVFDWKKDGVYIYINASFI